MSITKNENLQKAICGILYVFKEEIISILDGQDRFHKIIELSMQSSWKSIYFTSGSVEFIEEEKILDGGSTFNQSLKCSFPGEDESNVLSFLQFINQRPVILLLKYSDGKYKILGSLDNPCRLTQKFTTSVKAFGRDILCSRVDVLQAPWLQNNTENGLPDPQQTD